uniref:Signal anchor n=1 Tax=Rhizophora mucronata TaxID=61149 RepID=A0A2P2KAX0_RHIMU
MTDFRLCSTCQSCSQAGFCHCTQRPISDRSERTFVLLRYSLGGDRPSQTAHHTLSSIRITDQS